MNPLQKVVFASLLVLGAIGGLIIAPIKTAVAIVIVVAAYFLARRARKHAKLKRAVSVRRQRRNKEQLFGSV